MSVVRNVTRLGALRKRILATLPKSLALGTLLAVEIHSRSRRILTPEPSGEGKARVTATCRSARPGSAGCSSCHRVIGGPLERRAEAPPSHTWGGLSLCLEGFLWQPFAPMAFGPDWRPPGAACHSGRRGTFRAAPNFGSPDRPATALAGGRLPGTWQPALRRPAHPRRRRPDSGRADRQEPPRASK